MNTALWIAQALVAVAFLLSGGLKTFRYDVAKERMSFAKVMPRAFVMFIGVVELLGAVGVIVPSVTGIVPLLSVLAAVGLSIVMLGAIGTHVRLREPKHLVGPVVLLALCLFVAYGRKQLLPL